MLAAAAALVAAPVAAISEEMRVSNIRRGHTESLQSCELGHSGAVIIQLHKTSPEPEEVFKQMRAKARDGDTFHAFHAHAMRSVTATLTDESFEELLSHPHTAAVHADCHIQREEMARLGSGGAVGEEFIKIHTDNIKANRIQKSGGLENRGDPSAVSWNWGIDRVDSAKGLDNSYKYGSATGKGTYVYHMDSGVATEHVEFGGRAIPGFSAGCENNGDQCDAGWLPKGHIPQKLLDTGAILPKYGAACDGHGTHTASIVAGNQYGIAKDANIVVVQSLNCTGGATNKQVLAAVDWSIADRKKRGNPPAVMTLSLGGAYSEFLNGIGRNAAKHGFTVTAAAGNSAGPTCRNSPAAEPVVLAVGAIDQQDHYARFSNYGSCTDLFAPGSEITAAWPQKGHNDSVATLSGTSMATPHVAGAALQILQKHPKFTPEEVTRSLLCMATKNAIKGLDPFTPNVLLHTGSALDTKSNIKLLAAQKLGSGVRVIDEVGGDDAFAMDVSNGEGGGGEDGADADTNTDATRCYRPDNGPSKGSSVPSEKRVNADSMGDTDIPEMHKDEDDNDGADDSGDD